jgi:DNA-directed RNA polymerase subunit L
MNVRIQTYGKALRGIQQPSVLPGLRWKLTTATEGTAVDALQKGLQDLAGMCDVMSEEFEQKMAEFRSQGS